MNVRKIQESFTPEQQKRYDAFCADYAIIQAYRMEHNIEWSGPPYSPEEYAHLKQMKELQGVLT